MRVAARFGLLAVCASRGSQASIASLLDTSHASSQPKQQGCSAREAAAHLLSGRRRSGFGFCLCRARLERTMACGGRSGRRLLPLPLLPLLLLVLPGIEHLGLLRAAVAEDGGGAG